MHPFGRVLIALAIASTQLPGSAGAPPALQDCTTFAAACNETVLVGNNEDYGNPIINVWLLPADGGTYGRFLIGTEGLVQGGMNDQGLVYDGLTIPPVEVAGDGRPRYMGMWPVHVLETCATIDDVVESYEAYTFPGTWAGKLFFADAAGDAILIEGDAIVRKEGRFLVSTNFLQSTTAPEDVTCERFLIASSLLDDAEEVTPDIVREVLDAVHAEYRGGAGTIYSTVYDQRAVTVTCYLYHDFENPVTLDLAEELPRGPRAIGFRSLFPVNPTYETWRSSEIDTLARQIASFRDDAVLPSTYDDYVGHYAATAEVPFSRPPLALDSVSIERSGDRLCLVACPEGLSFELFPLGDDRFRAASMNAESDFDVVFRRSETRNVDGATLSIAGPDGTLFEVPSERISEEPAFHHLPGFMVPFRESPDPEAEILALPLSTRLWLGLGLALLGLLGLAVLLSSP